MGRRSQTNYDQPRDKRYSAYVYAGDMKFRKTNCVNRGKKSGKCYKWEVQLLDLKDPQDAEFVKSSMILIGEGEL